MRKRMAATMEAAAAVLEAVEQLKANSGMAAEVADSREDQEPTKKSREAQVCVVFEAGALVFFFWGDAHCKCMMDRSSM